MGKFGDLELGRVYIMPEGIPPLEWKNVVGELMARRVKPEAARLEAILTPPYAPIRVGEKFKVTKINGQPKVFFSVNIEYLEGEPKKAIINKTMFNEDAEFIDVLRTDQLKDAKALAYSGLASKLGESLSGEVLRNITGAPKGTPLQQIKGLPGKGRTRRRRTRRRNTDKRRKTVSKRK